MVYRKSSKYKRKLKEVFCKEMYECNLIVVLKYFYVLVYVFARRIEILVVKCNLLVGEVIIDCIKLYKIKRFLIGNIYK